jgi:hypothetical protein
MNDVILCDVTKLPLKSGSFNMIVASEIIEHLEEKKACHFYRKQTVFPHAESWV